MVRPEQRQVDDHCDREVIDLPYARGPLDADVTIPGSKSFTNRALILAALAEGSSTIEQPLHSQDTEYMAAALRILGIAVKGDQESGIEAGWKPALRTATSPASVPPSPRPFGIQGCVGDIPVRGANLFVGNAGTAMRFLTALVSLGHGRFELDGVSRMRERPIEDLLDALRQLGVKAHSREGNGCPPVVVEADGLHGGLARVGGNISSQYVSALLMVAPYAAEDVSLEIVGDLVSRPYVDMTASLMSSFGVAIENDEYRKFRVRSGQRYRGLTYVVEPDASSASYFFAAAAVTGGRVRVLNLSPSSAQGDLRFVDLLEQMGCRIVRHLDSIELFGTDALRGIEADMRDLPDMVPTLAAIAPFATGRVRIRNVGFIRHHETDRLRALSTELTRLGATVTELDDGLEIDPSELHAAEVEAYDDHRIAMAFAVTGMRVPGVQIRNPRCVEKTYPGFFEDFEAMLGS